MHKISGRLGNTMFQMAYIYAQMKDGLIPDVYVQDPKYFEKHEKEIQSWYGNDIGFIPEVAIHLRRGDYVGNPFYVDLSETDYYQKAMELFPNDRFLVFSDDIEFAKTFFVGERFLFSEGNDEVTDLNLMASCKAQIMANSSLSWWAGYLNPNPAKVVVAPNKQKWYSDGIERTMCPKSWLRI